MGKSTIDFSDKVLYKEANLPAQKTVFLGARQFPRSTYQNNNHSLSPYMEDIKKNVEKSDYYGCVLYPEETLGKRWSYKRNMAFIAGAIDANRECLIVTDINYYRDITKVTTDEIFWLEDNGYTFKPDPANPLQTKAVPPQVPLPVRGIKDYDRGNGTDGDKLLMQQRLDAIKQGVLAERAILSANPAQPVASTSTPTVTLESSTSTSSASTGNYIPPHLRGNQPTSSSSSAGNVLTTSAASSIPSSPQKPAMPSQPPVSKGKYVPPHLREKQEDARGIPTRSSSSSYSKLQSQLGSSRANSTSSWRPKPDQTSLTPPSSKEPSKPTPPSLSTTTPIQPAATKSWASVASTPPPASTTSKSTPPTPSVPPFPKAPSATRVDQRGFLDSEAPTSRSKQPSTLPKASPPKGYEP